MTKPTGTTQNKGKTDPSVNVFNPPATQAPNQFHTVTRARALAMRQVLKRLGFDGTLFVNNVGGIGEPIPFDEYTDDIGNWQIRIMVGSKNFQSVAGLYDLLLTHGPEQFARQLLAEIYPEEPFGVAVQRVPGVQEAVAAKLRAIIVD